MSKQTFEITFAPVIVSGLILGALVEIGKEMVKVGKDALAEAEWMRLSGSLPRFDSDMPAFEVPVPTELTQDVSVFNEVLRVLPVDEKSVQVVITDASLAPGKCEEIAVDFAQRLYTKATGRKISKEEVLVKSIASLSTSLCEHCLQETEGMPFVCKACGRTFCYNHRRPETHGCQVKTGLGQEDQLPAKYPTDEARGTKVEPKVIVRKIPCG